MHMDELLHRHAWATSVVQAVVSSVDDDDLARPTPCEGWALRDLLEHVVGQDHGFAAAAHAEVGGDAFAPRQLVGGAGPATARSAAVVVTAFATADPASAVFLPEFDLRLRLPTVVGMHLLDTLVPGWDVAAALGRGTDYPDELVAVALAGARRVPAGPGREVAGSAFGPPLTVEGASGWPEVLGLLGRDPRWSPPGG
jgi:uncharacterized protein (TIGR03086 family)